MLIPIPCKNMFNYAQAKFIYHTDPRSINHGFSFLKLHKYQTAFQQLNFLTWACWMLVAYFPKRISQCLQSLTTLVAFTLSTQNQVGVRSSADHRNLKPYDNPPIWYHDGQVNSFSRFLTAYSEGRHINTINTCIIRHRDNGVSNPGFSPSFTWQRFLTRVRLYAVLLYYENFT